jgi:lipopolysaccharide export system protein LptA
MHSKIHASMKHSHAALLLLPLLLSAIPAGAEKADRTKPMNIEADALRYDDLKQTSVFTGKVVLTKGTVVTAEPGRLAFYRQKREGVDEFIEGEADLIEYDGKADRVKFIRHAELRRFRGTTLNDEMVGNQITYDNSNDMFTVDGGPASPAVGGRVRAVLAPRPNASAPRAAAPVAPAQLRPSVTLDGGKK